MRYYAARSRPLAQQAISKTVSAKQLGESASNTPPFHIPFARPARSPFEWVSCENGFGHPSSVQQPDSGYAINMPVLPCLTVGEVGIATTTSPNLSMARRAPPFAFGWLTICTLRCLRLARVGTARAQTRWKRPDCESRRCIAARRRFRRRFRQNGGNSQTGLSPLGCALNWVHRGRHAVSRPLARPYMTNQT